MQGPIPTGTKPVKLHRSIEVHEINNSGHVVSMIETTEYKLAKFLDLIIKPSISDKYMLVINQLLYQKIKRSKSSITSKFGWL